MITSGQATQYMEQMLGISAPAFIVDAAVGKVATAEQAMADAGYSSFDQILIQSMATSIIAAAGLPRRLNSQGAPSGASRSFSNYEKALSALRKALTGLDTAGVVSDLVGPDPENQAFMFVVNG